MKIKKLPARVNEELHEEYAVLNGYFKKNRSIKDIALGFIYPNGPENWENHFGNGSVKWGFKFWNCVRTNGKFHDHPKEQQAVENICKILGGVQ